MCIFLATFHTRLCTHYSSTINVRIISGTFVDSTEQISRAVTKLSVVCSGGHRGRCPTPDTPCSFPLSSPSYTHYLRSKVLIASCLCRRLVRGERVGEIFPSWQYNHVSCGYATMSFKSPHGSCGVRQICKGRMKNDSKNDLLWGYLIHTARTNPWALFPALRPRYATPSTSIRASCASGHFLTNSQPFPLFSEKPGLRKRRFGDPKTG